MTGSTTWDALPRLIRYDRELASLSASSIASILNHIATDADGVARDIVFHAMLARDKYAKKDDAWQHAMLNVCELGTAKPDQLRELVTQQRWRYFFARLSSNQFKSTRSAWRHVHVRPDQSTEFAMAKDQVQHAEDMIDLMDIAYPSEGHEGEMTRFLTNLSILFKEVEWYHQRLFAIYHFDVYGWLPEERKVIPKARMSYRMIQKHTSIPHQVCQRAVQHVNQYIRTNYEARFGEPIPRHLLNKF